MDKIICPACKKEQLENQEICENCKFPFNGSEKEKAVHIGRFINEKGIITDSSDSIKRSQIILYAVAGIKGLFLIVNLFIGRVHALDLAFNAVLVLVFLLCAFYIKKKPILLTLIPLILLIGIYAINFLIEPSSLFRGIVVKLIILGSLIYSIYLINSARKFKDKFGVN